LHYVCQFNPPYKVVKQLYKANPKGAFDLDCKGRYPLHIACKHGCDPKVINFLIEKNPVAVKTQDIKNRTPLLLAIKSYVQRAHVGRTSAHYNLSQVARDLIEADEESCLVEDRNGFTALEYAINEELSIELVRFIQYKFEDIRKEIQSRQDSLKNTDQRNGMIRFDFEEWCQKQNYVLPFKQSIPHLSGKNDADKFTNGKDALLFELKAASHKARAA